MESEEINYLGYRGGACNPGTEGRGRRMGSSWPTSTTSQIKNSMSRHQMAWGLNPGPLEHQSMLLTAVEKPKPKNNSKTKLHETLWGKEKKKERWGNEGIKKKERGKRKEMGRRRRRRRRRRNGERECKGSPP